MKKKSISYSDLSKKELEYLKEFYVQKKVDDMSTKELKEFALEIFSHQIMDTIGKEEELEAWREISKFFNDQFEKIISEIKKKFESNSNLEVDEKKEYEKRKELLERSSIDDDKIDMWED